MVEDNFKNQPEFIADDFGFTKDTIYTRYSSFIDPDMMQGLTVLDVGCYHAAAGAYALANGAKEYIGIDIDAESVNIANSNLEKYYKNHSWKIVHSSIADYLKINDKNFDVVLLSRTLHGMSIDGVDILVSLSRICRSIVIESAGPISFLIEFKNLFPNQKVDSLINFLEYNYSTIEYMKNTNNDFYNVKHSIGFLKLLFNRLGFTEDFSSYENLKIRYPDRYGLNNGKNLDETTTGLYVVKFNKTSEPKPMSWKEFLEFKNV
jgi:ubiquinone/menaquinone biosynthesis C-methylase UbiE